MSLPILHSRLRLDFRAITTILDVSPGKSTIVNGNTENNKNVEYLSGRKRRLTYGVIQKFGEYIFYNSEVPRSAAIAPRPKRPHRYDGIVTNDDSTLIHHRYPAQLSVKAPCASTPPPIMSLNHEPTKETALTSIFRKIR